MNLTNADGRITDNDSEFPIPHSKLDTEVFELIKQLQLMQEGAEAVAAYQLDLRDQLKAAEQKALELHQKIVEEKCDVGGEA